MLRHGFVMAVGAMMLISCGGAKVAQPEWSAEQTWSKSVNGLQISLQSGLETYAPGNPILLRVEFKNAELKARFLDERSGLKGLTLKVTGPAGAVQPDEGKKGADTGGDFVKMEPGAVATVDVTGPATSNWSYNLTTPGTYKVQAVYTGEFSEEWNKQSVAGGKFEGQVLFTGTVESPVVTFEVQAPAGKK
jgi:hypothetical protein